MGEYLLEMLDVTKRFPGAEALKGVSLRIRPGSVHALVGENGAGKSTLMKILAGLHRSDAGEIRLRGARVEIESRRHALSLGIAIIPQEINPVPEMTVGEYIFLGREPTRGRWLVDFRRMVEDGAALLSQLQARVSLQQRMKTLSTAEVQLVEIAKAISYDSDILIMDEPTSALGEREVQELFRIVRVLRSQGRGIIYISHRLREVLSIADECTVLRDGRNVGTVAISELDHDSLVRMMVGEDLHRSVGRGTVTDRVLLQVRDLSRRPSVRGISLELRSGEILGLFGLMGAGKTEFLRALFGLDVPESGEIRLGGETVEIRSPRDAIKCGFALITEDRKKDGLFLPLSVLENIAVSALDRVSRFGVMATGAELQMVQGIANGLAIKSGSLQQPVRSLSGGNQQKAVVGRWLLSRPKVLLMDEPTRGVDVRAKEEIYRLMRDLADRGYGIIMASSELPEILGVSDRILVFKEGRVAAELAREEASEERLMSLAHD